MNRQIKRQQTGFTLIELVVVIVILGILAATALPKFIDLRTDAANAASAGVAAALASAGATNYAARLVNTNKGAAAADCSELTNAAIMAQMPAGYTVTGSSPSCTVTGPNSGTASFIGMSSS